MSKIYKYLNNYFDVIFYYIKQWKMSFFYFQKLVKGKEKKIYGCILCDEWYM